MMLRNCALVVSAVIAVAPMSFARGAQNPSTPLKPNAATKTKPAHAKTEGERIFAQNCARCHERPEGFSPSIAATVVRHMRVRASLSAHDEQELLRFFNP